jgi:hypothetical protein
MKFYNFSFLMFVGCANESTANDTSAFACKESTVFYCEDDEKNTGQMIFSAQVPDWDSKYDKVKMTLGRVDAAPLEGYFYSVDAECGVLWEIEFRLFNVSCEEITTKEIAFYSNVD